MIKNLYLSVFLVFCSVSVDISFGQVSSLCRQNERFLSCGGCQKTCRDPAPRCQAVCREGCYCEEDEFRNDEGLCVKLAHCPPNDVLNDTETSEPRPKGTICPENEEYRFCEPCNRTCDNPNPVCPAQCARGCFCKGNLVRNRDGKCVQLQLCQKLLVSESDDAVNLTCAQNKWFPECQSCERTCSNPNPECASKCARDCPCKDGLVMAPNGRCIPLDKCPQAEVTIGGAHEPSIEDCGPNEEYFMCGWCEPTCSEPNPQCSHKVCIRGCLCRPPLLRHHSGACLEAKNCARQKCQDPNEEYVCKYGCEARCDKPNCPPAKPHRCRLGCHCKLGFLREKGSGKCVDATKCFENGNDVNSTTESTTAPSSERPLLMHL